MTAEAVHCKLQIFTMLLCLIALVIIILGYRYDCATNSLPQAQVVPSEVKNLIDLWKTSLDGVTHNHSNSLIRSIASFPPHFQDCQQCSELHSLMDHRKEDGSLPPWNMVNIGQAPRALNLQESLSYIPWIADKDNLPLTRLVQRYLWLHQHPENCSNAKFLFAHWHSDTKPIGVGSQMVFLAAILSEAASEGRVFVTLPYHGARHEGCVGRDHSRWSCYFAPEASQECIDRAFELYNDRDAWTQGILKNSSNVWESWSGVPRVWGQPWETMIATEELDGMIMENFNNNNERRWWRAQAYRYLLRFPSKYLCNLLNEARNQAFGREIAQLIVSNQQLITSQAKKPVVKDILWRKEEPWLPRPMVSMHVRQGDEHDETRIHPLEDYIKLARRLRRRFPDVANVWLSTEMQNVVDETKNFKEWTFYFTNVERQFGTIDYMKSLGQRTAFDNSFVNLMMAVECDFFVGALGSSWSYAIDCLRMTGGKLNAGFLTVNPINL